MQPLFTFRNEYISSLFPPPTTMLRKNQLFPLSDRLIKNEARVDASRWNRNQRNTFGTEIIKKKERKKEKKERFKNKKGGKRNETSMEQKGMKNGGLHRDTDCYPSVGVSGATAIETWWHNNETLPVCWIKGIIPDPSRRIRIIRRFPTIQPKQIIRRRNKNKASCLRPGDRITVTSALIYVV